MATPYQRSQLKILLVEDNLTNQTVLLKQLTKLGYAASAVSHGQEAVNAIALDHYDIVLMDCQMPILNGYEATQQIRQREQALPADSPRLVIIALTANAIHQDYDKAIAAGMNDYLGKPVAKEVLEKTLDHWGEAIATQQHPLHTTDVLTAQPMLTAQPNPSPTAATLLNHLDRERLSLMADGSPEFEHELLQLFIQDSQGYLQRLQRSIDTGNARQVEHIAHYIKGASASVGAMAIYAISVQLEEKARHQSLQDCDRLLADIVQSIQALQLLLHHSSVSE